MTDIATPTLDRPAKTRATVARVSMPSPPTKPATVSATKLAQHLDLSRTRIEQLERDGVFQRVGGDGFNVDASRVNYIRHLRKERQQSPRGAADVEFVAAKTRLMRLRIAQKERTLMMTDEAMAMLDAVCGTFRTALSSLPAQIGGRDLPERRRVEHICNAALQKVHDEAIAQAEKLEREMGSEAGDDDAA